MLVCIKRRMRAAIEEHICVQKSTQIHLFRSTRGPPIKQKQHFIRGGENHNLVIPSLCVGNSKFLKNTLKTYFDFFYF